MEGGKIQRKHQLIRMYEVKIRNYSNNILGRFNKKNMRLLLKIFYLWYDKRDSTARKQGSLEYSLG